MAKKKSTGVKRITNKELKHVQTLTGDASMSKARIQSGRWFLPAKLDIGVYNYLKRKGKMK